MMPVTIASSFAFMLPVATPPNALVYEHTDMGAAYMVCTLPSTLWGYPNVRFLLWDTCKCVAVINSKQLFLPLCLHLLMQDLMYFITYDGNNCVSNVFLSFRFLITSIGSTWHRPQLRLYICRIDRHLHDRPMGVWSVNFSKMGWTYYHNDDDGQLHNSS